MPIGNEDIWFVDDDRLFWKVIKRMVSKSSYEKRVKLFDDGDLAIFEILKRAKEGAQLPKLIFLDLSMRYLQGWETLNLLKEFEADTKVVIVSANLSEVDRERAEREISVVQYLTKPISKPQIIACFETHLT
jgi:CheY-like chemotaxis protein